MSLGLVEAEVSLMRFTESIFLRLLVIIFKSF